MRGADLPCVGEREADGEIGAEQDGHVLRPEKIVDPVGGGRAEMGSFDPVAAAGGTDRDGESPARRPGRPVGVGNDGRQRKAQSDSPPSITMAWPVMNDERSETRKRIDSAISSGVANRPIGIAFST